MDKQTIAQDYAISESFGLSERGQHHIRQHTELDAHKWGSAPMDAIISTLDLVDREYGSVQQYMLSIGFDEAWQERLKSALLL